MNIILGPKGLIRPKENITKDFFESEGTLDVSVNCNNPVDALSSDDIAKRLIHSFEDWYNISTQIECIPDLPEQKIMLLTVVMRKQNMYHISFA